MRLELQHATAIGVACAATESSAGRTLADRVRLVWAALADRESSLHVLDQASGLARYDPDRYADLGRAAAEQYLPSLMAVCPADWFHERKQEVAALVLASLRGLLVDWLTSKDDRRVNAGLGALYRALEREESAG